MVDIVIICFVLVAYKVWCVKKKNSEKVFQNEGKQDVIFSTIKH